MEPTPRKDSSVDAMTMSSPSQKNELDSLSVFPALKKIEPWFAPDGLMKLGDFTDEREPFPGQSKRTVSNDNGILWRTYTITLLWTLGHDIKSDERPASILLGSLCIRPGLFCRNPGRTDRQEALDNYCAIVCLCVLHGFKQELTDIYEWGLKHGWTFNNTDPDEFNIKRWRQPSEVAFYKLAGGMWPHPLEFAWFIGSIIFNAFQKEDTTSEHLTMWLRLKYINPKFMPSFYSIAYELVKLLWIWRLNVKTNGLGIERIFDLMFENKDHPCVQLSKGVKY